MGKRIGIMGGSYDPPHFGHLIAARDAAEACKLDKVLFVPAAVSPHKLDRPVTPAQHRLEMVKVAVKGDKRFLASSLEVDRGGVSYTVETLELFSIKHPNDELFLIVGGDTVAELHTWKNADAIARLAKIAAVARPGAPRSAPGRKFAITWVDGHAVGISSTDIRQRVAKGLPIRFLVPDGVARYIERHGLYTK